MKAIGLKIKSGIAIAAIVQQSADGCVIEAVRKIALASEDLPQSRFPYHPTIELPERQGAALSDKAVKEVRRVAAQEMRKVLEEFDGIERAAMVVGSVVDPDSLGNPHVRVHALEGKLFREVVAEALRKRGIDCGVLVERDAYAKAAPTLASTEPRLRAEIAALGHGRIKPWRAEEKLATLAALWSVVPGEQKRGN
ncbi:MAG TPA: hypothetical protein VFV69_13185 [Steroidobacteraceae bacterium]|jgi:hypothetical protein|nr:hypothetical protein [Steroidobacteraceae bacterium]HJY42300.1 hypothetical protein [Steroidobacteraceae bacterium]